MSHTTVGLNPTGPNDLKMAALGDGTYQLGAPIPVIFKILPAAGQAITAGTPVALWAPPSGKKYRVLAYHLMASVATDILLKDNVTLLLPVPAGANVPVISPHLGMGLPGSAAAVALQIDVSTSATVFGWVAGVEEP